MIPLPFMTRAILLLLAAAAWLAAQPVEFWHLTDTHVVAAGTPGAKDQHRGAAEHLRLILVGHKHNDAIEELDLGERKVTQVRTAIFGTGAARRIVVSENEIELYATPEPDRRVHSIALKAAQK